MKFYLMLTIIAMTIVQVIICQENVTSTVSSLNTTVSINANSTIHGIDKRYNIKINYFSCK